MTLLERLMTDSDDLLGVMFEQATLQAVVDPQGRVCRVNAVLREAVGEAIDLGDKPHLADLFEPAGQEAVREALGRSPEVAQPELSPSLRLGRRNVALGVTPLHEPDGSSSGFLVQIRDVPPSAQAEYQVRGSVAHDLGNLLCVILATISEVSEFPGLDEHGREDLLQAAAAAQRGCSLVRQLSEWSHDRAAGPQAIEVGGALRGLTRLLRPVLGARIRLELTVQEPEATILIEPVLLDRIILNLCLNARDAMPDGGVLTLGLVGADAGNLAAPQDGLVAGGHVTIEVSDTGVGMPAEVRSRIFEPLYTTRQESGGTGLGLWSVQEGVKRAGGVLTVDSAPGQGTRFLIRLPRHHGPLARSDSEEGARPLVVATERGIVLLVDDEPAVLRLAERALGRAGWRVVTAVSGEAALAALRTLPAPDIIVSDLAMPGLDGADLLHAAQGIHPGVPTILTSGYAADTLGEELASSGARFLSKPYRMQALVEAVEDMILARDAVRLG